MFSKSPELVKAVKVPPIMPLIPYLPEIFKIDYLPSFYFTYFIVALAITAVCHEFAHGIFAKKEGVKIKTTGFAFLGPFIGAFVEPDEDKVKKLKIRKQLPFLIAGTFANTIIFIIFVLIWWLFFMLAFAPSGAIFNTYNFVGINSSDITSVTDNQIFVNFGIGLNLTEIKAANNKTYFIYTSAIKNLQNITKVLAYEDTDSLRKGISEVIIEFNGKKIRDNNQLRFRKGNQEIW
jgi:membrane-associated protease RseP (regulator of RpoE activity)